MRVTSDNIGRQRLFTHPVPLGYGIFRPHRKQRRMQHMELQSERQLPVELPAARTLPQNKESAFDSIKYRHPGGNAGIMENQL